MDSDQPDDVHTKHKNKNVAHVNDSFVFCRVTVPRAKALTNHSGKSSSTTIRNRFHPLQNYEVSQTETEVSLTEPVPLGNDSASSPTLIGHDQKPIATRSYTKRSGRKPPGQTLNMNPTNDIWDQKSLNLDTLFRVDVNENLRLGILNAESARGKENLIKKHILDNDLDILVIQESWLEMNELPSTVEILPCTEMYKLHQLPRPNRKNSSGGGMLCIYKNGIKIDKIPTMTMKLLEVMDLKVNVRNKTFRLVSVYRPPRSQKRSYPIAHFYDDMENLVSHYKTVNSDVVFCGDYNVHLNKPNESETRRFNDIMESASLVNHVSGATHIKGNTLDLVITDIESEIIRKCVIDEFLSDHAMVMVELNLRKPTCPKKKVSFRRNKDVDIAKLETTIDAKLKDFHHTESLSELIVQFNTALSEAYDEQAPLVSKMVTIRPPTPWSYDDIKKDKAMRRNLERKWRRTGLQIDWEIYRDFRNKYNEKLNAFRYKQYSDIIAENKNDPATLFRVINRSLHRKQASPMPEGLSNKDLADKFSNFFEEKIDQIRTGIDSTSASLNNPESRLANSSILHILDEFTPLTEKEVEKMVLDFPNKQCELDPLPLAMLKECLPVILSHLTKIVNLSLMLGDVPVELKMAIIRPLLKKLGLEPQFKNYRPVSNLSFLSKLIEKIVAKQFVDHMIRNKLMDPLQSAYKKDHSTETALLKVQNDLLIDIDKGNVAVLVLLDLSAAFDTIDHDIILDRLNRNFGIQGTALKWFRSYLSDRQQTVIVGDEGSAPKELKYGVPQGSVLGPLLFTAYMTPLKDVIENHGLKYHCYADDTQLYISFSPNNERDEYKAIDSLEVAINEIKQFMIANKLKLNDDKTEAIFLGTKARLGQMNSTSVNVGNSVITPTNKVKNLGVLLDKNLSMDDQVKAMCKAGFYHVKNLWKIRKFLDVENSTIAANAFVTSKLDYGNTLLAGAPKYQVKKLQSVQNAAARVVTRTGKYDHISNKLRDLKWLPVSHKIKYKMNMLTWKALNGRSPEYISEMISIRETEIDLRTGNTRILTIPKTKLKTMGDKAYSVTAPKTWNLLPRHLRICENQQSFKTRLKSLYLGEAFSSLDS